MEASVRLLALLSLATSALARTDLTGCTYSLHSNTRIWYELGTGEICEFLDCGSGRAPPKTTVPGCPLYRGTETYSPSFINVKTAASTSPRSSEVPATGAPPSGASVSLARAHATATSARASATAFHTTASPTASTTSMPGEGSSVTALQTTKSSVVGPAPTGSSTPVSAAAGAATRRAVLGSALLACVVGMSLL